MSVTRCARTGNALAEVLPDRIVCRHHKRLYVLTAREFTIICDCCHEPTVIPLPVATVVDLLGTAVMATNGA